MSARGRIVVVDSELAVHHFEAVLVVFLQDWRVKILKLLVIFAHDVLFILPIEQLQPLAFILRYLHDILVQDLVAGA